MPIREVQYGLTISPLLDLGQETVSLGDDNDSSIGAKASLA
jgi:hypothetical protein